MTSLRALIEAAKVVECDKGNKFFFCWAQISEKNTEFQLTKSTWRPCFRTWLRGEFKCYHPL